MRKLIPLMLLIAVMLAACSGQGTFNHNVTASTPSPVAGTTSSPAARKTPTSGAQTQEQPAAPTGGQETTVDKVSPDILAFIQIQLVGQNTAISRAYLSCKRT